MWGRRSRGSVRRREFLIESNTNHGSGGHRVRNRFLAFLDRFLLLRGLAKLFRASLVLWVVMGLMAGFIAFAMLSPYFNLKKISIVRNDPNLDLVEIDGTLKGFYGRNLIFLGDDEITAPLHEHFPEFRDIKVKQKWPSEIELLINVSPPAMNLLNAETANFAVVSEDGVILSEGANELLPTAKVFQCTKPFLPREKFFDKDTFQKMFQAEKFLQERLGAKVNAMEIYSAAQEFHLILGNGTSLWFDWNASIDGQVHKLELAANKIGFPQKQFNHIDLRIPKQIFFQ